MWLKVMVMEGELGERRLLMLQRPLGGGGGGARLEYGQIWLLAVVARLVRVRVRVRVRVTVTVTVRVRVRVRP